MMNDRKKRILKAIIDDYVLTGEPVGSRTIARKYMQDLSSATIRNEMSDLEEMGYLEQPHVSAGRVPNAKAYRLHVDHIISEGLVEDSPQEDTRKALMSRVQQMEDVVFACAQTLSDMTRYTSVIMMPRQDELKISALQLVPMTRATALLVIVTDGGIIRDSVVHISDTLDADGLYAISRMLTERLGGRSIQDVQSLLRGFVSYRDGDPRVLLGIAELAEQIEKQSSSDNLTICGPQNILNHPEYADVAKARGFLAALEEKESLLHLMRLSGKTKLDAFIGPENGIEQMQGCSVVTASYEVGRGHRGAVALIGPTRMPYLKMLSALASSANMLSRMLRHDTLQ